MRTLRVGVMHGEKAAPLLLAVDKGLTAKHGVDVEVSTLADAHLRDAAFLRGELDIVLMNLVSAVLLRLDGHRLTVLVSVLGSPGTGGMFRLIGRSASAEPGMRVGLSFGTIADYSLSHLLRAVGLRRDQLRLQALPDIRQRADALVSGDVDLAVLPEPVGSNCVERGCVVLASDFDMHPPLPVLCARPGLNTSHGQLLDCFTAAYAESVAILRTHPEEAGAALSRHRIGASERWVIPEYTEGVKVAVQDIEHVLEWCAETGRSAACSAEELLSDLLRSRNPPQVSERAADEGG